MEQTLATAALEERIEEALNTIRPYLEADGGNLRVVRITDDLMVHVELLGSCGHCPMSAMTMKAGIEQAVKSAVPEVKGVYAINLTPLNDGNLL